MNVITENEVLGIAEGALGHDMWVCEKLSGGGRNFCFKISSCNHSYVLRVANWNDLSNLKSGLAWHTILAGKTLVMPYFKHEFDKTKTRFPWLLMNFSEGEDIVKIYGQLTSEDKRNLSHKIYSFQNDAETILEAHDDARKTDDVGFFRKEGDAWGLTWEDFIINSFVSRLGRLELAKTDNEWAALAKESGIRIKRFAVEEGFNISPKRFLWDIGDRNVLVQKREIVAIIDVDEVALGDRLLAPALAWVAIGQQWDDFEYANAWATLETKDNTARARLAYYKIFWIIWFAGKYGRLSTNGSQQELNFDRLKSMLRTVLGEMNGSA